MALLLAIVAGGCGKSSQSSEQALQSALKTTGGTKEAVARFGGTVTIDGKPPEAAGLTRTLVILSDPTKPLDPKQPALYVPCNEDGTFEFTTYEKGDGVPAGHYVVCFVQLQGSFRFGKANGWHGTDGLKNLYNDPDKNKGNSEFAIEITPPGKQTGSSISRWQTKKPSRVPARARSRNCVEAVYRPVITRLS